MTDVTNVTLAAWTGFYVVVGSAGAALIAVQFVVVALIAGMRQRPTAESLAAFATPTAVHLAAALLVSAIMNAPWPSLGPVSVALVTCGAGGIAYGAIVLRRARRQTFYKPERQDWLWYALLPWAAYAGLALAAAFLGTNARLALFGIGAATLGLLLVGIHNAWDTVTHIVAPAAPGATKDD